MKKFLFVCFFLLSFIGSSFSQKVKTVKLTGQVFTGENHKPVPFVNVVLYRAKDTTKIFKGTITDFHGYYELKNLKQGKYRITFSFIGYLSKTIIMNCNENKIYTRNISLHPDTNQLSEVEVSGSRKSIYASKTIYSVSKSLKQNKNSTLNLIPEVVEDLKINPMNQKLSKMGGGKIEILVNGTNADENDLLVLNPKSISKIIFYDIPPARYANSGFSGVVNIITKTAIQGFSGAINLQNAVTTGFGNNLLTLKYNKKNTQIAFTGDLNYRNYDNIAVQNKLNYDTENNDKYSLDRKSAASILQYQQGFFKFNLTNHKKDDIFQLGYTQNFNFANEHDKQMANGTISNIYYNGLNYDNYDSIQIIKPVIDIYYEKHTKKNNLFVCNAVATYFKTSYKNNFVESQNDTNTIFENLINNNSNKYSLISDIYYSQKLKLFSIDYGYTFHINRSFQEIISSLVNERISLNSGEHNVYSSLNGQWKKFSYMLQLGIDYNYYNYDTLSYQYTTIKPYLSLNYGITQHSNLHLSYNISPNIPSLSQLNPTKYYIEQNFIYSGNPNLKPYNSNEGELKYSLNYPRFNFSLAGNFYYAQNAIFENFIFANNNWVAKQENQSLKSKVSTSLLAVYSPFKSNWFKFTLFEKLYKQNNKNLQNISNNLLGNMTYLGLSFIYKMFSIQIQYQNAYKELYGNYIIKNPTFSNLKFAYQKNNFSIALLMAYPFSASWHYEKKTTDNSPITMLYVKDIYNNGRMVYLNFSYHFSHGKGFKEEARILENGDNDTGILQRN